jgi:hypothetical protein
MKDNGQLRSEIEKYGWMNDKEKERFDKLENDYKQTLNSY